jgi:outer membrane protein assembly factor BamE (lipoprotein component of BamABCDE complex)
MILLMRIPRQAGLLLLAATSLAACASHLYAHQTLAGRYFPVERAAELQRGLAADAVRNLLGEPLQIDDASSGSTWRYFEVAKPRWCDSGRSWSKPPEYTAELILTFDAAGLTSAGLRTSGALQRPPLSPELTAHR